MSKPPTSAHDAWLKSTLGLDVAKTTTAAPPLPPAPPDKQSQEFRAQFEAALEPVDAAIAYLSSHAADPKTAAVASKREVLLTVYGTALAKVDPADEAKGKPALAKALVGVQSVAAEAGTAQQEAEKFFAEWTTREPELEEAAGEIEEMEEWGYDKVAPLRTQLDAVEGPAEARNFDVASAAADQLLAAMKPVVDDYEKQKAAKEKYDPAYDAQLQRLQKVGTCMHVKLAAERDEIGTAQRDMEANAQAKNYVDALKQLEDLTTQVGTFETALEELERRKAEFDEAWNALKEKLGSTEQSTYKKLVPDQQAIAAAKLPIEAAEQAEDFDQAMPMLKGLDTMVDAFLARRTKLDDEKKAFDKAWDDLQPKLGQLETSTFKKLQPMLDDINKTKGEVDAAAQVEDYENALRMVGDLSNKVDAYLKKAEDTAKQKEAFEQADRELGVLLLDGIDKVSAPSLASPASELRTTRAEIKPAIEADDYEKALELANDAKGKASTLRAEAEKLRQSIKEKLDTIETDVAQLDVGKHPIKEKIDELIAAIRSEVQSNAQLDKAEKDLAQLPKLVQQLKDDPAAKLRNNPDYQTKLRTEQELFDARETARADYDRAKAAYEGAKVPTTGISGGLSGSGLSGGVSVSGDLANSSVKSKEVDLAKAKLAEADHKLERAYQDRVKLMQKAGWKGKLPEKGQDYPRSELPDFVKR